MCGIIGYVGERKAKDILLDSLALLEYRGYDSAGIALSHDERMSVIKCAGRVSDLIDKCNGMNTPEEQSMFDSICGIGHTRWATHGNVSDNNAHPHMVGDVVLVHNGIVENYKELIEEFHLNEGLKSQTDTEVVAALLNLYYQVENNPKAAIYKTVEKLKGTFAFVIMFKDKPGKIYSIRNVSPIVATQFDWGCMLASDVSALCSYTNKYFVLPEYSLLVLTKDTLHIEDKEGNEVTPDYLTMDWGKNASDKGGYPFYMEKEIMEQPDVIENCIKNRIVDGMPDFSGDGIDDEFFNKFDRICIVACGTAMHAGLVFQSLAINKLRMPVDVWMASEFIYSNPIITESTLIVAISQSGETIDTLEALKYAKANGAVSLSIINVQGSAIAYESDYVLYTNAGPEIAVASTKAYTTQLAVLYLLVAKIAAVKNIWSESEVKYFLNNLMKVLELISAVLDNKVDIHKAARIILDADDLFMIGRGLDYSILREGSLKLKEVSYIHSESYAAGELKHGPIALITDKTPVVAVMTQEKLLLKELSNIREVKSRGAGIMIFAKESFVPVLKDEFNVIPLPNADDDFMTFPASVALQILAYFVSSDKGFDVDKPRNLAKVVTVE